MLALAFASLLSTAAGASSEASLPVVSVLYFDNNTSDPELEFMRKGLADLLITDLVAWEGVRVVERTRLEDVLKELNFQQTKYVDKATATKLGKVLNANFLIYGSMLAAGKTLKLQARLVRSSDGEVMATVQEQDDKDKIFDLEQRLANGLVAQIDSKLSANAAARRKAKVPDLATLVAYSKALDLSDQGKLDEAQAAMRAVVSKSPTFLLGRERQQQLLKSFEEYQKRKKDLIAGSVLELGQMVDAALKDEPKYDAMSQEEKQHFLIMRMLKGRFLARVLKQYLGTHDENFRIAKKGEEGKALLTMRNWLENQRKLISEFERGARQHATVANGISYPASMTSGRLTEKEANLVRDSKFGETSLSDYDFITLARFVWEGRLDDGTNFTVGPIIGSVDPKEGKAVKDELDARIKAALTRFGAGEKSAEHDASSLMEFKASLAVAAVDIDGAVGAYQQILDNFPTSSRASWVEGRIKNLLEGGSNEFRDDERWAQALKGCDDMDIRIGVGVTRRHLLLTGLKGLDEVAAELEKVCKITRKNQSAFAYMYKDLAMDAARHDDCDRFRQYFRKYLEAEGSVSDMLGYQKNWTPWCELGDVQTNLSWLKATLDRHWSLEFDRNLHSQMSNDGKVFFIDGSTNGPKVPGGQEESFDLRLEKQKDGSWLCVLGRWRRSEGDYIEGTCKVNVTSWAPADAPGFDQGTFEVTFPKVRTPAGYDVKMEISKGEFKVPRNR